MGNDEPAEAERSRRLILSISGVLRAAEPGDAAWQIRVHELARLLERAAESDPNMPLVDLTAPPKHLTLVGER